MKTILSVYLFASALILNTFVLEAQQDVKILCGDYLYKEYLNKKYPGFKESYEKTLFQIAEQVEKNKQLRTTSTQYTVNVVVHVVWKDPLSLIHI